MRESVCCVPSLLCLCLERYLLGGWNLQSVVAYVLVLALIPVFKPWQPEIVWQYDSRDDFGDDETLYSTAGIVSEGGEKKKSFLDHNGLQSVK